MGLFDGIRNLFDRDEEEEEKQVVKTAFSPYYHTDYEENKQLYDQANYYWSTGEFPVIQYEEKEKTGYEQEYEPLFDYHPSPTSPLFYMNYRDNAVNKSKEELEEEAKNKRGTLDRIFGMISNNSITQGLYYTLDDDEETTFGQGVREGFRYMNPFEDDVTNRKSFHDIIELRDDDPTDDKFGENAIEAILGFVGDVALDPTTYISGGATAIGKVVKGSGAVVKGSKFAGKLGTEVVDMATGEITEGLMEQTVRNADDVANLFKSVPDGTPVVKTARDTVESAKKVEEVKKGIAQNLYKDIEGDKGIIKVMDFDTAKKYITEHASGGRYTPEEINQMAENLVKGFNKTMFGLETGGQDLTVFGQKLVSANTFRNIGDKTIAPYYNKLATKIRQSKIANKFGTNPYSKTAYDDFTDAFRPYFNDFMLKQNKLKIAKGVKNSQDFVIDEMGKLSDGELEIALRKMDDGTFQHAKEYHEDFINLRKEAIKNLKKGDEGYNEIEQFIKENEDFLSYLTHVETTIRAEAKKPIDVTVLESIGFRKGMPKEQQGARIYDELSSRKDELERLFKKPFEEFTDSELDNAKALIELEHDPVFGIYGELSAFGSAKKSLSEILYDFVVDDSVYDLSSVENIKATMRNIFGDEIQHNEALKSASEGLRVALKKQLSGLYKPSSINSGNFGKKSARIYTSKFGDLSVEEFRSRCDILSIFDKTNTNGYYLRTYGDDVRRIQDALVQRYNVETAFEKSIRDALERNDFEAYRNSMLASIRWKKNTYSIDGLLKLIKENSSNPALYEEANNLFKAYNNSLFGHEFPVDKALTENLLAGIKKKINTGLAISKTKSKNVDSITKYNVIRNIGVDDRVQIAQAVKQTNETRFYQYINSLSGEELYAKYFSPNSTASDTVRDMVLEYKVKGAYYVDEWGVIMLDTTKLDDATIDLMSRKIAESSKKLLDNIDDAKVAKTDLEAFYTDKHFMEKYHLDADEFSYIKSLNPENELYQFMKRFQDKMSEIAANEEAVGVLMPEQVAKWRDRYVKRMLTPEAQKLYADNPEAFNRLGFYVEGISVTKRSNKSRKYATIDGAEKAMREAFPDAEIEKFFETDLATLYCKRCLESDKLIGQKENLNYIIDNLAHPYTGKGSVSSGRSLVVNYEELSRALMKAQGIRPMSLGGTPKNIDFSVLKQFGIDPDFVTANNPFIRIGEDEFETLNEYIINSVGAQPLDDLIKASQTAEESAYFKQIQGEWKAWQTGKKSVSGYAMGDDIIEMVNQNSMAQNSLSESAFWRLYDKFLSTYKMVNTIYSPAFYGNNALGNAFNSFLYSGAAAFDPNKLKIARGIASTGDPQQFLTLHGEKYSYKQLRDLCSRLGISNTSFYEHEIREDASKFANFSLNKKLLELSSGIEDTQRIALFVEALDNTGDLEQAVNVVNKFLFDYSDLTDFEHKVMKRAIPFYTFMRKNAPMQLEQIFTNPRKYRNLNYGFNNIEVMAGTNYVEDYERNDWRRDYIQTPFQINGENIGVNLNLPYQQLDRLTPSKIFGQTSPVIKAIPELAAGKYAYTGMDINSTGEYIANQISPLSKVLGLLNQDSGLDTALYAASQSGINFATIDNQLENQKELIDKHYPYINSENVGFDDDGILEALIKKYKGVDE